MRKSVLAFCLTAFFAAMAAAAQSTGAPDLRSVIPAGSEMVILVENAPDLLAKCSDAPLARMWDDPQVRRFFAPAREEMGIDRWEDLVREATGFTLDEIKGAFTGQVAVVLPSLSGVLEAVGAEEGSEPGLHGLAVLAHVQPDVIEGIRARGLERSNANAPEGTEYRDAEEDYQGETLYVRQKVTAEGIAEEEGWAIVQGVVVLAQPKTMLQELVAGLKRGGLDDPWSGSEADGKLRRRTAGADILFYLDFTGMPDLVGRILQASGNEKEGEEPAPPNPMGLTAEGVLKALRLDAIEGIYVAGRSAAAATEIEMGLFTRANEGLVKAMAYMPGPVALPEFMPPDAVSAAAANFSFQTLWGTVREILGTVSPPLMGLIDMQLQQLAANAGVDLEKSLIGSLGDYAVSGEFLPEPGKPGEGPRLDLVERLVAIELRDRQGFERGLEALKSMFGQGADPFEQREYLGTAIHGLKLPFTVDPNKPAGSVAYAVTDRFFLMAMGSAAPLEASLARMRTPGESLWKKPEVRAALEALPAGASGVSIYDFPRLMRAVFSGMASAQKMTGESGKPFCDPEAIPDVETLRRYFATAAGGIYRDPDGLFGVFRMPHGAP